MCACLTTIFFGYFQQLFCSVLTSFTLVLVQNNGFNRIFQFFWNVIVNGQLTCVDNPHGHALLNCMIEEYSVNGFTYRFVTTEREGYVRHTTRNHGVWQVLFNPASGFNEIDRVVVVFFNTSGNCKHVRVKNNVFGREANIIDQHIIRAFTNFTFTCCCVGLSHFVKSHHNNGCTVLAAEAGFFDKLIISFF